MKIRILLTLLLLSSVFAGAQTTITSRIISPSVYYIEGSGAPSGNCSTTFNYGAIYFDHTNLVPYFCANSGWLQGGLSGSAFPVPSAYSTSVTYVAGAIAYDGSGNNYSSLSSGNLNNALSNTTFWHFLGGVSATITGGNCVTTGQVETGISTTGVPVCGAVGYLNGAAIPASQGLLGTNSSGQLVTGSAALAPSNNLSDVASQTIARANLSIPKFSSQISFGDSITYGYEASSPNSGYPYWISSTVNSTNYTNQGYIGYQSGQMDSVIIGQAFNYSPTSLITYVIGTNNVNAFSTTANQAQNYLLNVEAQLPWWLIPSSSKTLFATGSVTYTGTWSNETQFNIGKFTSSSGGTATFTGTGTILYLVTQMLTSGGGTATLTCDGSATGATLYFSGFGGTAPAYNQTALTRVSGLSSGAHSCVVTQTSGTVALEWASFTTTATKASTPFVVFGGVPTQNTSNSTVITAVNLYRTDQQTAVTLFQGDGYSNIGYADTSSVGGPSVPQYYNDQYHFTDYGYYLLAVPFISEIDTLVSQSYAESNFIYRPVTNFAPQGGNSMCLMANSCGTNVLGQGQTTFAGVRVEAMGTSAAASLTSATDVVAIGFNSLTGLTTGVANVGVGSQTLQNITNGARNTALGSFSLFAATGASGDDTGVGDAACQNGSAAYSGTTCVGSQAGFANTGANNVFVGFGAGNSGTAISSDTQDTIIGATAGKSSASIFSNSVALGYGAQITASNQISFGNSSVTSMQFAGAYTSTTTTAEAINLGNGIGSQAQYIGFDNNRVYAGFDGLNAVLQGNTGKGVGLAYNNATFGSGYGALLDGSGNFGVGTQTTAATSDNFYVTPAGVATGTGFSETTANCLAAASVTVPCLAGTGTGTALNGTGTTGTVTFYTSNAPAGAIFNLCEFVAVDTAGTAGTITPTMAWTTPGGLTESGNFLGTVSMTAAFNQIGACMVIQTKINTSFTISIAAGSATGTPAWEYAYTLTRNH